MSGKVVGLIVVLAAVVFFMLLTRYPVRFVSSPKTTSSSSTMTIQSSAFENGTDIPSKYTCDGENVSPPLVFGDVPSEARSLALIMHDPDAPMEGGFTHWVAWNIDPHAKDVVEGGDPPGAILGANGAGTAKYTGPCPPSGSHRYYFYLYALDSELISLEPGAKKGALEEAMQGHIVAQAELMGRYERKK
jgi:Raf kinase inhibitor-like YbhB/YbcL family protein